MNNTSVINNFLNHKPAKGSNLSSPDGKSLWSYGWWELASWNDDGTVTIRNGPSYSHSTARHRSHLVRGLIFSNISYVDSEWTPASAANMRSEYSGPATDDTTNSYPSTVEQHLAAYYQHQELHRR